MSLVAVNFQARNCQNQSPSVQDKYYCYMNEGTYKDPETGRLIAVVEKMTEEAFSHPDVKKKITPSKWQKVAIDERLKSDRTYSYSFKDGKETVEATVFEKLNLKDKAQRMELHTEDHHCRHNGTKCELPNVTLFDDSEKEYPCVLSKSGKYAPENMYIWDGRSAGVLRATIRGQEPKPDTSPIDADKVFSVGMIRYNDCTSTADRRKSERVRDMRNHAKIVLKSAFSKEPLPTRVVAKLLLNDDHWQMVMIDLQDGIENPKVYIVNTTNMFNNKTLESIREEYFDMIGGAINDAINEVRKEKHDRENKKRESADLDLPALPVEQAKTFVQADQIKYIQGLQAGPTTGCAITTDINFQEFATMSSEKLETYVFTPQDIVKKEVDDFILDDIVYKKSVMDYSKSKDRSVRRSVLDESIRRLKFHREMLRRNKLKMEIATKPRLLHK